MNRFVGEGLGTGLLLAAIVGSGIMGERLAHGNAGIALLANSIATGAALYALITMFGQVSGAHFNPAVTLTAWLDRQLDGRTALGYVLVQCVGGLVGVLAAHLMFELPLLQEAVRARTGGAQWFAEALATFGLVLAIRLTVRHHAERIAAVVACYITAAYWFTASTSFANPAVTFARAWTDTFAGIRFHDAPGFIAAQLLAAALAWKLTAARAPVEVLEPSPTMEPSRQATDAVR